MVQKLEPIKEFDCSDTPQANMQHHKHHNDCVNKINELCDIVNALVKENNIHEKQIDELQMRTEMLEKRVKALDGPTSPTIIDPIEQPDDPFAEQKKWIGCLCRFWNDVDEEYICGILVDIDYSDSPYKIVDADSNCWLNSYKHCEPVKPDDDIIYKGE